MIAVQKQTGCLKTLKTWMYITFFFHRFRENLSKISLFISHSISMCLSLSASGATVSWLCTRQVLSAAHDFFKALLKLNNIMHSVLGGSVIVLGKLFTPIMPLFTKWRNW